MTADGYDPLYDRLEQILSALPVIESRRDSVRAAALFLYSLSRSSLPGEDINPTTTKQADQTLRPVRLAGADAYCAGAERSRDAVKDVVDIPVFRLRTLPGEYVNPTTRKQAERELLALRKQAGELRSHVGQMNKTALDAMGFDKIHLGQAGPDGGGCTARPGTVTRSARKAAQAARRLGHLDRCLSVLSAHRSAPDSTHRSRRASPTGRLSSF